MFSISFQHSRGLVLGIKETFLSGRSSNLIFLKLNPISIHSYEVIMHGIYTDSVTGACLHPELKIWLNPARCSVLRLQANVIQFFYLWHANFQMKLHSVKTGFIAIYYLTSKRLIMFMSSHDNDNFLHKTAWKYRDNYGRNMLQTRYSPSVTPIIKTQYGPHSSQIESWKMIEFLYAEVESKIGRWRYLMYIERDRL